MKQHMSKQPAAILSILLLSIAIMLSGNALSADGEKATVVQLNAVVATQATTDADQNTTISSQGTSITTLQSDLDKAQQDISDLKALIEKYHPTPKKIGDHFGGGIVFYVDETGQHGLIASLSDQAATIPWYNGAYKVTGATGDGVGAGATNTSIIVAAQMADNPTGNFAAKVAADFSIQDDGLTACTGSVDEICHGDWYLPSKHELNLLYQQKGDVGGFAGGLYWSSTEYDAYAAWYQYFYDGSQSLDDKGRARSVRAVRAF